MISIAGEGSRPQLDSLEPVIAETINTLETGQKQLSSVAENARSECMRLSNALVDIEGQLAATDEQLEQYGKDEMLTERQSQLQQKKQELEISLLNFRETAEKAENMVSQVGVVKDFIRGNLRDINVQLEGLKQRQQLGLQIIKAQEEERKRLSREIHDGPAQSLANVVLRMEFCEKLMDVEPDKVRDELRELKKIVKNNLQDVRKIIFDLRPMALDDLGVVPALKRYIEDFRDKNNINILTSFRGRETRFEPGLEIALFRLIQEALNNVVKHARASEVKVSIDVNDTLVKAVVEDNGVGFIMAKALNNYTGTKFGLISMKERTDLLGGNMNIETKPGQGTKIMFAIPVP